jgi:hypothetical protein
MMQGEEDTWDLASSVGATATMVAAARAVATRTADPLITDPFAERLVRAVWTGIVCVGSMAHPILRDPHPHPLRHLQPARRHHLRHPIRVASDRQNQRPETLLADSHVSHVGGTLAVRSANDENLFHQAPSMATLSLGPFDPVGPASV